MIAKFDHSDWLSIVARFKEDGFVIVQGLIQDSLQLEQLREAADRVVERTRGHEWPYKRTVGKQFPPWKDESSDVWGVQHIMHPALQQPAFAACYFSAPMLEIATRLSEMSQDENAMAGLLNLLIEPQEHEFQLSWHRDSIKSNVDEKEELENLSAKAQHGGVQWNLALYPDECLFVVPGSHLRPRTPIERQITTQAQPGVRQNMPGEICASLAPGDAVFYDPQILHRGTYDPNSIRRTLHGAHLDARADVSQSCGILQHFQPCGMFYDDPIFLNTLPGDNCSRNMANRMVQWASLASTLGYNDYVQENI